MVGSILGIGGTQGPDWEGIAGGILTVQEKSVDIEQ
jgi:hypothetical protein